MVVTMGRWRCTQRRFRLAQHANRSMLQRNGASGSEHCRPEIQIRASCNSPCNAVQNDTPDYHTPQLSQSRHLDLDTTRNGRLRRQPGGGVLVEERPRRNNGDKGENGTGEKDPKG